MAKKPDNRLYVIQQTNYWRNSSGSTRLVTDEFFRSVDDAKTFLDKKKEDSKRGNDYTGHSKWKDNTWYRKFVSSTRIVDHDGAEVHYKIIPLTEAVID
jgi:hypothetical protein